MHQVTRSGPSFVRVATDGPLRAVVPAPGGNGPEYDDVRVLSMHGYVEFATAEQTLLTVRLYVDLRRRRFLAASVEFTTRAEALAHLTGLPHT